MSKLVLIILMQLLYVPMLTLRTISMVKNLKVLTAVFGFLESMIYIFGLAIVLSGEQSVLEMIVYALGFSIGLITGIFVEQKLAIGFTSIHININHNNPVLVKDLRDSGFGVTVHQVEGKNGERVIMDILTKRKREPFLIKKISAHEPDAFIISYEPKMFKGGYLTDMMKKRTRKAKVIKGIDEQSPLCVVRKTLREMKNEVNTFKKNWKE
ncbi:MAG: DUF2179 domain-containing protein [Maledivibacter sp.]|nr:DUF2179 domain-containing protein [Maledivibacter sp.]